MPPEPPSAGREGFALEAYDALPGRLPEAFDPPALPEQAGAPLRAMRAPAGWSEGETPGELLAPVLDAAARQAHKLLSLPGSIRSLTPLDAADARLQGARKFPTFPGRGPLLRGLECVALAQRIGRGDDPTGVLDGFHALLARPGLRTETWRKTWVSSQLRHETRLSICMETMDLSRDVSTLVLTLLRATGPVALAWVSQPPNALPAALRKTGRALLAELNELAPPDAGIELVGDPPHEGESLDEFLDILGWDHASPATGPSAEPGTEPSPDTTHEPATCFWVPARGVVPERFAGVSPAQLDRLLWLCVIAREVLWLLGSPGEASLTGAGSAPMSGAGAFARGAQRFDRLASSDAAEAPGWLRECAAALAASPWAKGLFRAA